MEVLKIVQLILVLFLTVSVMVQAKGTGLSSAFGNVGGFYRTKRGVEKGLFILTIIVGMLFVINSILIVLFS